MNYLKASKAELKKELEIQRKRFDDYKAMGLSYNMTRGKPDSVQLALSDEMLDPKYMQKLRRYRRYRTDEEAVCGTYEYKS